MDPCTHNYGVLGVGCALDCPAQMPLHRKDVVDLINSLMDDYAISIYELKAHRLNFDLT